MPKCDVEELVKKYGARLRDPASLETAARHFNVSRDAIFYRLTELGVFKWSEKSTYFGGTFPLEAAPTQRVETIDAQVDVRFRDTALSLHYSERISTGKLAEWFFAPRHVADGYLADLRKKQDLVISDQPADEDGELAGGE
jgi:hypothetical protein